MLMTISSPKHRLCPLLNGSMKQDDIKNTAFMGGAPPAMMN